MKTAVILDCHNLYLSIKRRYPGYVLNYTTLIDELVSRGFEVDQRVAFGRQPEEGVKGFATVLRKNGFTLCFGQQSNNTQLALEAAHQIHWHKVKALVLGSNYHESESILRYARNAGVQTLTIGVDLPVSWEEFTERWELDSSVIQPRKVQNEGIAFPPGPIDDMGCGLPR